MSSTVSLVPSLKTTTSKKRRPTFRPGAIGSRKKVPNSNSAVRSGEEDATFANDQNQSTGNQEDIPKHQGSDADETTKSNQKRVVTPSEPRSISQNRTRVAVNSNDEILQNGKAISSSKDKLEIVPTQASLASFCTKYRAEKRSKETNLPSASLPVISPEEEEEEAPPTGPQVKIVDGEIVLQESSIMVPNARKTVQEVEEEFQHVVEEEGHTTIVGASYNSFVARRKPQHWSVEETKLFYNALRQVGADFVTMEAFFRNRSRKQLKKKYQIEQVKNPHLIELALDPRNKLPVDLSIFNVDKDSIVVTKQPIVPRNEVRKVRTPAADTNTLSDPVAEIQDITEPKEMQTIEPSPQDIFDGYKQIQDVDVEAFVLEQEMGMEKPSAVAIPLAPTVSQKTKSKRPKFRAGMRKGK